MGESPLKCSILFSSCFFFFCRGPAEACKWSATKNRCLNADTKQRDTWPSVLTSYPGDSYFIMTRQVKFKFRICVLCRRLHESMVAGWRAATNPGQLPQLYSWPRGGSSFNTSSASNFESLLHSAHVKTSLGQHLQILETGSFGGGALWFCVSQRMVQKEKAQLGVSPG